MFSKLRRLLNLSEEVDQLKQELSKVENLEQRLNELEEQIKVLEAKTAPIQEVQEVKKTLQQLQTEVHNLTVFSLMESNKEKNSSLENLKKTIIELLSRGEVKSMTELKKMTGASWRELYAALKELEKEKKIMKKRKKKRVVVTLTSVNTEAKDK
ncbi:hypothetical protein A3L09_10705 (plasmid) [Thermococcus profundus]|uniref:Uncharacterized protein n=1 Tax=Thermococcus profundus TaxID=49899 RepID=A0A2Z2MB43_THEPR|nr:hypothetical protein [Thermococcus profundus]ASJ03820.1 hypothetical protein A3L09_10705 [Thermococcus profundus]